MEDRQPHRLSQASLRQQAEAIMIMSRSDLMMMVPAEVQQLIYELQVHQVELELQNEELRRVKCELEAVSATYRALYDEAPVSYCTVDSRGVIQEANQTLGRLLDQSPADLRGCSLSRFFTLEEAKKLYLHYQQVRTTNARQRCELCLDTGRDAPCYVRIESSAVPSRGEQRYRTALIDITDRVQAEESQRHLERQLRQTQKMEAIGTLAGGIAHEFNNILSIILGFTELAKADSAPRSPSWSHLQEVRAAGQRAKELVEQILAFSRDTNVECQPIRFDMVVTEALRLLRASLPSTIDIQQHPFEDVGTILGNATQIQQVIINLCSNAAQAMPETGGRLQVRVEAADVDASLAATHPPLQPGPHVCLTVHDTGHGMAPDVLERIFDPFFTTKEVGQGTGMGLAIVHGIVSRHSGRIEVESMPYVGTTFTIYFPRLETSAPETATAPLARSQGRGTLLVVDDETAIADVMQRLLEKAGYEVLTYTDSHEALAAFGKAPHRFDLVITDQTMPHLTGETLARELRRLRPEVPIILCTGFSHAIDAQKAWRQGIDAFVMKPVDLQELVTLIEQILARRRQEG